MTEQEKAISQLCIAMQEYCNKLREEDDIGESYYTWAGEPYTLNCIEDCIEKIHRIVNPDFDKICETVENAMEVQEDDEREEM